MKAAVIHDFAQPPRYDDFQNPQPDGNEVLVNVEAAAVSQLVRAQASGKHYSSGKTLPVVPGVDGVGRLAGGERVYFAFPTAPFGALAQQSKVQRDYTVAVPEALESNMAAALANPGMSSWAALTRRAHLQQGESVLINGATGTSGRLAVKIARHLGAGHIVATGRNEAVLRDLGADEIIVLNQEGDELTQTFRQSLHNTPVNVILDYLWGQSAQSLLSALSTHGNPEGAPRVRFVQIGSISAATLNLEGGILRSSGLELMGSGLGSVSNRELVASIGEMLRAAAQHGWSTEIDVHPLSEVEQAWQTSGGDRLVLVVQ